MNDSGATFSADRVHRYELWRCAGGPEGTVAFIGLNPSTADEVKNDPTVERCLRFASKWGFAHFFILNIFAYRTTYPKELFAADEAIGRENDRHILNVCQQADLVVAAWGVNGSYMQRGTQVEAMLRKPGVVLWCLGLTKGGFPRHPLYVRADTEPEVWVSR